MKFPTLTHWLFVLVWFLLDHLSTLVMDGVHKMCLRKGIFVALSFIVRWLEVWSFFWNISFNYIKIISSWLGKIRKKKWNRFCRQWFHHSLKRDEWSNLKWTTLLQTREEGYLWTNKRNISYNELISLCMSLQETNFSTNPLQTTVGPCLLQRTLQEHAGCITFLGISSD